MSDSIQGMKSPSQTEVLGERARRRRARLGIALGALTTIVIAATGILLVHSPFSHRGKAETPATATTAAAPPAPPPAARAQQPSVPPLPATLGPTPPPQPAKMGATSATEVASAKAALRQPEAQPPATANSARATQPSLDETAPAASSRARHRAAEPEAAAESASPAAGKVAALLPEHHAKARKGVEELPPARAVPAAAPAKTEADELPSGDEAATAAIAKAESAFSGGHMASARISATQAVAAATTASDVLKVRAYVIMGKVELASERFAEAERAFDRALAIEPGNPLARKGKERAQDAAAKAAKP